MSADITDEERFTFFQREREMLLRQIKLGHERNGRLVAENDLLRSRLQEVQDQYRQWSDSRWLAADGSLSTLEAIGYALENLEFTRTEFKEWDAGGRDQWFDHLNKDALAKADSKVLEAAASCEFVTYDGSHLIAEPDGSPLSAAEWDRRELRKQINQMEGRDDDEDVSVQVV